jgi:hypothetical protein
VKTISLKVNDTSHKMDSSSHDMNNISHHVNKISYGVNSSELSFTSDEIAILKKIAKDSMNKPKENSLLARISGLEKGQKTRKTIVINHKVGELLDQFAEQSRFNKSDLLEIAILDLIERYNKNL